MKEASFFSTILETVGKDLAFKTFPNKNILCIRSIIAKIESSTNPLHLYLHSDKVKILSPRGTLRAAELQDISSCFMFTHNGVNPHIVYYDPSVESTIARSYK